MLYSREKFWAGLKQYALTFEDDIDIVLQTSEGIKNISLSLNNKGCYICTSVKGGLSETHSGIFLTINGQKTQKI